MALAWRSEDVKVDTKYYESSIGMIGFECSLDYILFYSKLIEAEGLVDSATRELASLIYYYSAGREYGCTKDDVCRTLIYIGLPEFMVCQRGKFILNADKSIPSILDWCNKNYNFDKVRSTNVEIIINAYNNLSKLKTYFNSMNSIQNKLVKSDDVTNDDKPIVYISSNYTKKITGRYYTENYNLQGWNKQSIECFTAKKDYFLIWADFAQIDFRVACNIMLLKDNPELKKYFIKTEDKYEAFCRMIYADAGVEFDYQSFLKNRKAIKASVLSALYGAGLRSIESNFTDKRCAKIMYEFFEKNKGRNEYIQKLKDALNYSAEIYCTDYLGEVNRIPVKMNANEYQRAHELKSAINNSIQSTSNSIVMNWCNTVIKYFRNLGFGSDMFRVYLNRHDEIIFEAHKSMMSYMWIFEETSKIFIDDWFDLKIEPNLGYNYTIVDKDLTENYNNVVISNSDKITEGHIGQPRVKPYVHCGDSITLYSFAPVHSYNFILALMKYEPFFNKHIDELISLKGKVRDGIKRANELIDEYMHDISKYKDDKNYYWQYVFGYKLFGSNYFKYNADGGYEVYKSNELLPYLKSNNINYVTIINYAVNDYSVINDIQFKYQKAVNFLDFKTKIPNFDESVRNEVELYD